MVAAGCTGGGWGGWGAPELHGEGASLFTLPFALSRCFLSVVGTKNWVGATAGAVEVEGRCKGIGGRHSAEEEERAPSRRFSSSRSSLRPLTPPRCGLGGEDFLLQEHLLFLNGLVQLWAAYHVTHPRLKSLVGPQALLPSLLLLGLSLLFARGNVFCSELELRTSSPSVKLSKRRFLQKVDGKHFLLTLF